MSSPTERTPAKVETLLGGLDMETLMAFADNDIESIYETLQEPFEDMERKIVVSSMVQEAVAKGFLKALEEESCTQLACKDREIGHLKDRLKEKDASIADLQKVLGIREDDVSVADSSDRSRYQQLWDFMQESQKKWRESEASVHEKERELERLASSMAHMASILDNENKRAALLNKQLNDLKEQETIKTGQISSLQQEINKLKNDNSRLKRQARLKVLQFDESMERTQAELQQQRLELERLAQEREGLEKALEDKNKAFSDLENDYRASEYKVCSMDEKVKSLLMVESTLQEIIEGQKLMQEGERDMLMTYMEQQMITIHSELGQFLDGSQSHPKQAIRQWQLSSWDAGDTSEAKSADDMKELTWKADVEGVLVQVVMEGWYKEVTEVLHKLTFELAWKDEGIFYRDTELRSLKQAVEELENDYATLMSICLTLIRDQNDNDTKEEPTGLSVHELGRRKLLELSEFLNSREAFGGQEEKSTLELEFEEELAAQQLQHELKLEIVSEVFKQDVPSEFLNSREVSGGQEGKSSPELELEEELAGLELQHELVLEIVSEVFVQKYQEALYMVLDLKFTSLCDYGTVETVEKKVCNNFEELEAQLESFLELEACRLERIRSGCSTSIAKCEFKLENLMKSLADQVNEMKTKISFVQEAIKQQEWKHMVEEDILVLVLWDALAEMYRKLNSEEFPQQIRNVQLRLSNSSNDLVNSLDGMDTSVSPKMGGGYHPKSENESQRLKCSKIMETRLGIQDKDKLILSLKRDIEGLRKEKAIIEQNLDERTEELYSLKRQFWKEKEIWVSKLSQPQRKEVEVQVEALSRHSSASLDLQEEFRKLEMVRFDSLISELRKEWLLEKEGLLHNISQKEVQGEKMAAKLARLKEKEKSSNRTEAGLLARIADLKIQADNLSSERLNQDFHFAKCRQEWQTEKESMRGELDKLLEKERGHVVSEGCLLARIAELETEMESSRLARLHQDSSFLKLKQEWQTERERLLERVSEREDTMSKLAALSEKEKSNAKLIEQLETERDRLITGWRYKEPSATSLMEEKEIVLALAIKEKEEEEKKRKFLEIQLQGLRLEVKNLQGLNDKVAHLKGKLESVPRQLEVKFAEQIGHSIKASQEFEQRVIHMMQEKSVSLDGIKEKCRFLKGHFKSFATREAFYKQRLAKELNNLQKAETEVDLLGDEVESLLDILEEVQVAFDLYAPVLQHYPRMTEVAKLVKQEIQLRIDPKYGT